MCVDVRHAYCCCQLAGQGLSLVNLTLANAVGPGQLHWSWLPVEEGCECETLAMHDDAQLGA